MTLKKHTNTDEPIRIAQIGGKMNNGGVETVVMNYYRNIDRSRVQFDFIIDGDSKHPPIEEIEQLGGRAYIVTPYKNLIKYIFQVYRVIKNNNYKIVHSHLNTMSVFPLLAAFLAGARVRIVHNHSTAVKGEPKTLLKNLLKPLAKIFATHYFACSEHAGRWLFGDECFEKGSVKIVNNAIDLNKFKFNKSTRAIIRAELGIEDKLVIGHVGRVVYPKNHDFLIDIFEQIYKRDKNTRLLLVGEGNLKDNILKKIKALNLENAILFLGVIDDVASIYQAMDAFVLPSLYEGFGMVGIEAQAAGIKLFCSEAVPEEVKVSDLVEFISLERPAEYWAQRILQNINIEYERLQYNEQVGSAGYDIQAEAERLLNSYYTILYKVRHDTLMEPLISIIVPIFNVENYLHKCINSIVQQTYRNLEIILVNDGSEDNCGAICDEYAEIDGRIKVIHKENGGLSDARNVAIDIVKGEYITFIDSDDFVEADYVEYLYKLIQKNSVDVAICNINKTLEDKYKKDNNTEDIQYVYTQQEAIEQMLYQKLFDVSACAKLYKAELFKTIRYPKGKYYEDLATTYLVFDKCTKIVYGSLQKYNYIVRENSISTSKFSIKRMELIDIAEEMLNFISAKYPDIEKAAISKFISSNFQIFLQTPKENSLFMEEKRRIIKNIKKYRKAVLFDGKSRNKNKLAVIFSYGGMTFLRFVWIRFCNGRL